MSSTSAPEEHQQLTEVWRSPYTGLRRVLSATDHKTIGKRFVVTALIFLVLGGVEALLMRMQLSRPDNTFLSADTYNQLFTVHGSTMMFLFAVPVMEGVGLYVIPLTLGTRALAFPRLASYGYWVYLIGGALLYSGFLLNIGPDAGWFSYVPLSGPEYSPGKRVDVWAQMVTFTELASLAGAVNIVVTIFKHRAPGMTLDRMPLFAWAQLVTSIMVIFAMPAVMLGSTMLAADRLIGTHFFNPYEGGDPLLWQHIFWFFGHPEVYIIFIPALGMLSTLIGVFTRRQVVGYPAMVLTLVSTGFIGFGVWVHHMFTAGLPQLGGSFFTASSILIALPTGIQIFCWIATLWTGRIRFTVPMLFALCFFVVFLIGGLTGIILASVPIDTQVHDSFFVVAHLHYVLIGGAVFPLLGALYFWFPKAYGRMLDDNLGRITVALMFVGFNTVFFPMHILGILGMPRRVFTYSADRGWNDLNLLASAGAVILGIGVLVFVVNALISMKWGKPAIDDPWGADGLEWSTSSPPPPYNFHPMPTVSGRYSRWSERADQPIITGLKMHQREQLATQLVDAEPDHRVEVVGPSLWPFSAALSTGVTFIGAIFTPWAIVVGGALAMISLIGWFWPKPPHREELAPEQP